MERLQPNLLFGKDFSTSIEISAVQIWVRTACSLVLTHVLTRVRTEGVGLHRCECHCQTKGKPRPLRSVRRWEVRKSESYPSIWDALAGTPGQAVNLWARVELMQQIAALVKRQEWTRVEAASRCGGDVAADQRFVAWQSLTLLAGRTGKHLDRAGLPRAGRSGSHLSGRASGPAKAAEGWSFGLRVAEPARTPRTRARQVAELPMPGGDG